MENATVLCERVMQIWTSPSEEEEEEEEEEEDRLATFWFGTFAMLLAPLGVSFVMKTFEDKQ